MYILFYARIQCLSLDFKSLDEFTWLCFDRVKMLMKMMLIRFCPLWRGSQHFISKNSFPLTYLLCCSSYIRVAVPESATFRAEMFYIDAPKPVSLYWPRFTWSLPCQCLYLTSVITWQKNKNNFNVGLQRLID